MNPDNPKRTGHHPEPIAGCGWEKGQRVAITEPEVYAEPPRMPIDAAIILDFLLAAMSKGAVGERSILLAHLLKTSRASKNLRELGLRLGCSHVAASRRLNIFQRQMANELRESVAQS